MRSRAESTSRNKTGQRPVLRRERNRLFQPAFTFRQLIVQESYLQRGHGNLQLVKFV